MNFLALQGLLGIIGELTGPVASHVKSKLHYDTDFVSCSSKTTHDSNLLFWKLKGRKSLMRDNAQFDRKLEYIMYDLGRLYRNS